MKKQLTIDMTHGPLLSKILLFSLPLMASNILQMLFNAADTVVVGRYAGNAALAAVGSTASLINLFIQLLIGLSVGVNVLIARYLGMTGQDREISRALHTAMALAMAGGTALALAAILLSDWALGAMGVPDDVRPLALLYMRIYFIGTPFMAMYNYGAAALRAQGDTRRPLVFLLISGVVNVLLNLFFVIALDWGVAGVGWATVASQVLSAALTLHCLKNADGSLHFCWKWLSFDRRSVIDMARIGIPAGVQATLFSLSNVVLQGAINSYGSVIMAGCSAAMSIENLLYISMNSFHQAGQTFVSQNIGAKRYDRIGRIARNCLLCTVVLGVAQSALTVLFSRQLIGIYNSDPAVITAGVERLWTVATLYTIYGVSDVLVGLIRGHGIPLAPVVINMLGVCVFRMVWVAVIDTSRLPVTWVYLSYPISWVLVVTALAIYWINLRRKAHQQEQSVCTAAVKEG